jgi:hypothetical protein
MRKPIFILLVIFLLMPLFFSIVKFDIIRKIDSPLVGAYETPVLPTIFLTDILNGKFQTGFEKYFNYKLRGRSIMSRTYNQMLYTVFQAGSNNSILIGKNGYLFELAYPEAYLNEPTEKQKHDLHDKILTLAALQETLKEMGKSLFVIITPSKVSIYPEYLPDDYRKYVEMKNRGEEYSQNFYEYFISQAGNIGLKYFDYHDTFLELKKNEVEIFSKGGTHWNGLAVIEYFNDFIKTVNLERKNKIGMVKKIKVTPVWSNAFMTDNDLEILLNLFPSYKGINIFPKTQFYSYHMETLSIPTAYRPDVFVMGGSFNWTWLSMLYGVNGWVGHGESAIFGEARMRFYNLFEQKYPENIRVSETTDDFQSILNNDILIVEFNEQAISPEAAQFIFTENLLKFILATKD